MPAKNEELVVEKHKWNGMDKNRVKFAVIRFNLRFHRTMRSVPQHKAGIRRIRVQNRRAVDFNSANVPNAHRILLLFHLCHENTIYIIPVWHKADDL